MQRRAAIWILGAFKTSPTEGIEAIVGLIPIKYYLQKLGGRSQLCATFLPSNHIIQTLMDSTFSFPYCHYLLSLSFFTNQQKAKIKSHLVDSNKRAYGTFPSFSPLYPELSPGVRIIDTFSDHFSFNHSGKNDNQCLQQLDSMVIESSLSQSTAIVAMDASIKNNIVTSISHTHTHFEPATHQNYSSCSFCH